MCMQVLLVYICDVMSFSYTKMNFSTGKQNRCDICACVHVRYDLQTAPASGYFRLLKFELGLSTGQVKPVPDPTRAYKW